MSHRVLVLATFALAAAAAAFVAAAPAAAEPVQPPQVAAVSPPVVSSHGGTSLEVIGHGFDDSPFVTFYDSFGTTLGIVPPSAVTDSELTITTFSMPAGTVDLQVRTSAGLSNLFRLTVLDPPTIASLSPSSGPAAGGTPVTIHGTHLTGATELRFGTTAVPFVVDGDESISTTAPPGAGTADVTVVTAVGTSDPVSFAYLDGAVTTPEPPPTAPASAPTASAIPTLAPTGLDADVAAAGVLAAIALIGTGVVLRLRSLRP